MKISMKEAACVFNTARFYTINTIKRLSLMCIFSLGVTMNLNASPLLDYSIENNMESELENWIIVNDTVMGGRSRASLSYENNALNFEGYLSLRNNGGFASVRRVYSPLKWENGGAIRLIVKGDGRSYQFRLRTNRYMDGVAYASIFKTSDEGQTELVFTESDFKAVFRGREIPSAAKLQFSEIEQIGLMLADKQSGEFSLRIKKIEQIQ